MPSPDTSAPSGAQDLEPLPLFDLRLTEEDLQAVAETLRSGWLSMGPITQAFERAFAEQLGAKHAVAMSSCTAALHLAYLAVGRGAGRRGDRAVLHVRRNRQRGPVLRRHARVRRHHRLATTCRSIRQRLNGSSRRVRKRWPRSTSQATPPPWTAWRSYAASVACT